MAKEGRRRRSAVRGRGTLVLTERVKSRDLTDTSGRVTLDFEYDLIGTSSEQIAYNHLTDNTPRTYQNLFRMEMNVRPIQVDEGADTGHWFCTVRYGTGDVVPRELTDSSFTFDTMGGTQHITQSKVTLDARVPGGGLAPNNKRAIGVDVARKQVEGVDIPSSVYNFSESHVFPDRSITPTFKGTLFSLKGKMNNLPFKGFQRGECLFQGVVGTKRGLGDWVLDFRFSAAPNETNIEIGDIMIASRLGWDYLWVAYKASVDDQAHAFVLVPAAVYVERVLDFGDFGALGIGT